MKIFLLVFVCISGISFQSSMAQTMPANVIPEFTFYTMTGQAFTKKELKPGKKIIIVFFDATCDHCQVEISAIGKRLNEFKSAEFYLISMDDAPSIQKFMNRYGKELNGKNNVTLLRDRYRQFIANFLPKEYPALFAYGPDHHLIRYFGRDSQVSEILKVVNTPSHLK